ncbi:MAG: hypothetical protein FP816_02955 [Desulfobacteraceae bacterium]|nr:hypothetical protein [Desulfobacteraceae bacterium]MBU4056037.1 hypothetical protein [Pseudomonadota bacterium]
MTEKRGFKCEGCNRTTTLEAEDKAIPECCGQPMKQDLAPCTVTDTAEHARMNESGEPCDDGRAGKG